MLKVNQREEEEPLPIILSLCTDLGDGLPMYHRSVEECFNAFLNIEERVESV